MELSRRDFVATMAASGLTGIRTTEAPGVSHYARYEYRDKRAYGLLEQDVIHEIRGGLFGDRRPTGVKVKLTDVKLLHPCEPTTVLAVGLNYKSHLGNRPAPTKPEFFFKPVTSLVESAGEIVIPPGAKNVHYEGEFVIVIGKTADRKSVV